MLDRQIGRFAAPQNFGDVTRGATKFVAEVRPIAHQTPVVHRLSKSEHRRQTVSSGERGNGLALEVHERIGEYDDGLRACTTHGREGVLELLDRADSGVHNDNPHALGHGLEP